jgi:hypothetical protein
VTCGFGLTRCALSQLQSGLSELDAAINPASRRVFFAPRSQPTAKLLYPVSNR